MVLKLALMVELVDTAVLSTVGRKVVLGSSPGGGIL